MVDVPNEAILEGPSINWKHVDGALLSWAGQMHWLTWVEKWRLHYKLDTVDDVASKRFPHLAKLRAELANQ